MPALNLVLIGADDCRHRAVVAAPSALDGWGGWTIEHILLSIEKRFGPRLVRKAGQGEPFNRALQPSPRRRWCGVPSAAAPQRAGYQGGGYVLPADPARCVDGAATDPRFF